MRDYFFTSGRRPPYSAQLCDAINAAAGRLAAKLASLSLPDGALSPFSQAYLTSKMRAVRADLQRNCSLLAWALSPVVRSIELRRAVLLDYGAGVGDLSLLAKELGVGTVIHNDIYDVMCRDAHTLASSLGLEADYYVVADVDGLLRHIDTSGVQCHAVVSNDAIEHIYDVEDFLTKIPRASGGSLSLLLATGANPRNIIVARRLMRLQQKMESEGDDTARGGRPA